MTSDQLCQALIQSRPLAVLRKDAKAEGWGRVNGGDYCPGCMESMEVQS
jgi:hypothetical protein